MLIFYINRLLLHYTIPYLTLYQILSRENSLECGGVGRGVCVCGQCACAAGWSGAACDCTDSTDTCASPATGDVCSGHGDCVCGE